MKWNINATTRIYSDTVALSAKRGIINHLSIPNFNNVTLKFGNG